MAGRWLLTRVNCDRMAGGTRMPLSRGWELVWETNWVGLDLSKMRDFVLLLIFAAVFRAGIA